MVLHIAASLINLVRIRFQHTNIDNYIFQLHYRWTSTFCFLACALLMASDYIGQVIQCYDSSGISVSKPINAYCWVMSTFTINNTNFDGSHYIYLNSKFDGTGTFYPERHIKTYHSYYQWVPFILFLQGSLFYIPHLIWKIIEGKKADTLLHDLQFYSEDENSEKMRNKIIKYLQSSWGYNEKYFKGYMVCEIINFINVIGQMFFLNTFFGGVFITYGTNVLNYLIDNDKYYNPMITTFPRITKCNFYKFGPSGSRELLDYTCILPQNMLNEKIFTVMWFWFVCLATITAIQIVWHIIIIYSPVIRIYNLEYQGKFKASFQMKESIQSLNIGDYFLLDILGHNLDAYNFKELLMLTLGCKENRENIQYDNENNYYLKDKMYGDTPV
ncbi:innexin inx2-like [Cherax quadricarinatus]|uniref:innexin inx2-like n=1 Tax=Cherax quadricarinatus TaxID=27406 RepID=UPI00387E3C97